jgi:hypothetical protein
LLRLLLPLLHVRCAGASGRDGGGEGRGGWGSGDGGHVRVCVCARARK